MSIRIAGAGCCLMDILYPRVDFRSAAFEAARSRRDGDGGLSPGRLVFSEDAERFTGRPFAETLASLAGGEVAAENIGGPSVVALIHAAQMLEGEDVAVSFHGATGMDAIGRDIREKLSRTPLDTSRLESRPGRSPTTVVFSDPGWDGGRGERCFVNDIAAAELYLPGDLHEDFFKAEIIALGGTALVPGIHEGLPGILAEARSRGALTMVNTVFDFRAERRDEEGAWPLGGPPALPGLSSFEPGQPGPPESYRACDLLVMDRDEALRLSGKRGLDAALRFFEQSGVGAFAVTRGGESVLAWSGGGRFLPFPLREMPVCDRARLAPLGAAAARGDTTGCGDAFAGGTMAALALQMGKGPSGLDLEEALSWGIAAGGFTLGFLGGTFYESRPGEKRELVSAFRGACLAQASG
jgi:sugar/nucleoside kinase (ribokinase family)